MQLGVSTREDIQKWAKTHKVPRREVSYTIRELEKMDNPLGNELIVPILSWDAKHGLFYNPFHLINHKGIWNFNN